MLLNKITVAIVVLSLVISTAYRFKAETLKASFEVAKQEVADVNQQLITLQSINDNNHIKIEILLKERSSFVKLMAKRDAENKAQKRLLEDDIKAIRNELNNKECMAASFPDPVIKRLQQSY
ncbi:hypothetical protein [Photobacterium damselae]|uniref:hypothetical protein n=1 Tax=Photobacterium damselae TaxID=38293 RepID=UPI000D662658|nr:hypothetical protein [Photobacterium damselae]AWK83553.1 hypothetical protein BST98_16135 [Photobacterium damselae]